MYIQKKNRNIILSFHNSIRVLYILLKKKLLWPTKYENKNKGTFFPRNKQQQTQCEKAETVKKLKIIWTLTVLVFQFHIRNEENAGQYLISPRTDDFSLLMIRPDRRNTAIPEDQLPSSEW